MYRLPPVWSPDSKKLAFADKTLRLYYVNSTRRSPCSSIREVTDLTDYSWSPDSKWIAYAKAADNTNGVVYLYSLDDKKISNVTTSFTNSWNPIFDPEGKYLYFLSTAITTKSSASTTSNFESPAHARLRRHTSRGRRPLPSLLLSDEVIDEQPRHT